MRQTAPRAEHKESGAALVIVLLLVLVIAGMIGATFLSISNNAVSTGAYRTEAETLLIGDAGLQEVIDWFSSPSYISIGDGALTDADLDAKLSILNPNTTPIVLTSVGKPVTLSSFKDDTGFYPSYYPSSLSSVVTSFQTRFDGSTINHNGNPEGSYRVEAKLLSYKKVRAITSGSGLSGTPALIERWLVEVESHKQSQLNNKLAAVIELGATSAFPAAIAANRHLDIGDHTSIQSVDTNGLNTPGPGKQGNDTQVGGHSVLNDKTANVLCNNSSIVESTHTEVDGNLLYFSSPPTVSPRSAVLGDLRRMDNAYEFPGVPPISLTSSIPAVATTGGTTIVNSTSCSPLAAGGLYQVTLSNNGCAWTSGAARFGTFSVGRRSFTISAGVSNFGPITRVEDGGTLTIGAGESTFTDVIITGNNTKATFNPGGVDKKIVMKNIEVSDNAIVFFKQGIYEIQGTLYVTRGATLITDPGVVINVKDVVIGDTSGGNSAGIIAVNQESGTLTFNVDNNMIVRRQALLNFLCTNPAGCSNFAGVPARTPVDFIVNVRNDITLEATDVFFYGLINSDGDVYIGKGTVFCGGILGDTITVQDGSPGALIAWDKHIGRNFLRTGRFRVISWVKSNFK